MRTMLSRLTALVRRRRLDGELSDEVGFHLAMLEEEFRARGMSPAEAKSAARREFGGVARTQEMYRDRRGIPWLETSLRDIRYALRGLRRNPGFTAAAVLSLALGIGASTAVFSLFYVLMVRNLPVARPEELVTLYKTGPFNSVSYPLYEEVARRTDLFRGVIATSGVGQNVMARAGRADDAFYEQVTGNFFAVLGVAPVAGRLFSEADDRTGNKVAVLSYDYWQRRFGGARDVVGHIVGGCTVIGVAPPGFRGVQLDRHPDLWLPLALNGNDRDNPRMSWIPTMMARRRPDVSRAQVQAALDVLVARHFRSVYSASSDAVFRKQALEQRLEVREGDIGMSMVRDQFGKPLGILMATVGIVLLAACANVAHLLLARGAARRREIALRLSLGATRARLVRQALTESLALAAGGCALGALLALWGRQYVLHFLPMASGNPFGAPDRAVLAFAAGVSLLSAALFGLAPALRSTAVDPAAGLRGEGATPRGRRGGLRAGLAIAQVAFSVVLVVLAALFGRSLGELRGTGAGFRNQDVIVFQAMFPTAQKDAGARFLAAAGALPGIGSWSSGSPPYRGGSATSNIRVPGSAKTAEAPAQVALCRVAERYFETLGARILFGREFNRGDAGVKWDDLAIVNREFVREFLPGEPNPIGRTLSFDDGRPEGGKPTRIIGVVDDLPHQGLRQQPEPTVYLHADLGSGSVVLATRLPAQALLPAIRRELSKVDAAVLSEPQTIGSRIEESIFQDRILASLSAFFGAVALLLTGVGVYGVVAFKTAQRTGEIGIRIALGAARGSVLWLVLRDAMALVALGLVVGLPAAFAAARAAGAIVFGVKPGDPWLYVSTAVALLAAGMAAALLPARRAAAMDPMRALRSE